MKKNKYFNCPMAIFENYFENPSKCLEYAANYALWNYAKDIPCGQIINEIGKIDSVTYKINLNDTFSYDNEVKNKLIEKIKFSKAEIFFEKKTKNPSYIIDEGKKLVEKYNVTNEPFTNISTHIWCDYYKNENKTEWQHIILLAFLGIRSIIGSKKYCKVTNNFLFARMAGFRKSVKSKDELPEILQKYYSEHYMKKIREELEAEWGLKTYHGRGYYASFDLDLESLMRKVIMNSTTNKRKVLAQKKKELANMKKELKAKILNECIEVKLQKLKQKNLELNKENL